MFAVCVQHRECQLIMYIFPFNRIFGKICHKIFGPVVVPFIIKTYMIIFYSICKFWPQTILLRDQKGSRNLFGYNGSQMFQEFHSCQIFVGTVNIRFPLSIFSAIIQIKHGIHIIQSQSVKMKFFQPVKSICKKEIFYHRAFIIIKVRAPHWMDCHGRIRIFI